VNVVKVVEVVAEVKLMKVVKGVQAMKVVKIVKMLTIICEGGDRGENYTEHIYPFLTQLYCILVELRTTYCTLTSQHRVKL
jgi:hypothetical protein